MAQKRKENLFEMGANFGDGWSLQTEPKSESKIIKTQSEHRLHVAFEKRRGKPVTLVGEFFYGEKSLKELHKKIKKSLACGGAVEDGFLIFQGDHREKIKPLFEKEGWKFKS